MNIYYYIISVATVTLVWAEGELFTYKAKKLSNGSNHHDHLKLRAQVLENCTTILFYEYMCEGFN